MYNGTPKLLLLDESMEREREGEGEKERLKKCDALKLLTRFHPHNTGFEKNNKELGARSPIPAS